MPKQARTAQHASSHLCRLLCAALVVVLLLLSLYGDSLAGTRGRADGSSSGNGTPAPATTAAAVSLQAACHTEMKMYCNQHPTSPLRCLVDQYSRTTASGHGAASQPASALYSDVCASWLAAREACLSFVHERGHDLCGAVAHDARECLRQIPPLALPHACASSAYYESVRLVGKLRQHNRANARLQQLRHGAM